jgi:hypothetical protein
MMITYYLTLCNFAPSFANFAVIQFGTRLSLFEETHLLKFRKNPNILTAKFGPPNNKIIKCMKRNILLFLAVMAFVPFLNGQSFFWESFDAGQMPPAGWSISGLPDQWSVANSATAGGLAPEGKFSYVQQTTTSRLISPMTDLTGLTTVKFSFKYFYDWYSNPAPKVGVATRSHNGTWNTVWETTPTGNVGPKQIDLDITNGDVGQTEFQICVYLNGNMYNLDYFYVDNMLLFNPLNNDAGMTSLSLTPNYFASPIDVKGTIMNFGNSTITSAEIQWQLNEGTIHTTMVSGLALTMQQSYDFACADLLTAPIGTHNLKVWIKNINGAPDDFRGNDTATKVVNKVCHVVPVKPIFEEFTSSTCAPCASFNTGFVPWCNTNEDNITLIKYQMSWPAPGDPYYTAEGGVRKTYYGVSAVPDLYCGGGNVATDMGEVQNAYNQAIQDIGMMKIAASHTFDNHIVTVNASVLPFSNFNACKVHIVVMEKVTHNNIMNNGETAFEHVMMKMIPDAEGTAINFTDRTPVNITQTVDLTGTHVEEWNDLIVAVFVQDHASQKIYQSAYSVENAVLGTEARLFSLTLDGEPVTGFSPDAFTYAVHLPTGTSTVPEVAAVPIDTNETVIIVPADELPGATTVDVFAENLMAHNIYTLNFSVIGVGMDDPKVPAISLYPNPTKGTIWMLNADHSSVTVTNSAGFVVKSIDDFSGTSLSLENLPKGVYVISVGKPDRSVVRKKIVLM